MASFIVEYAKSGRSACKHCKLELAKGEVRIGIMSKGNGGFNMTKWHHSKCLVENTTDGLDILKAKGFGALKVSDRSLLKDLFQQNLTKEAGESRKRVWTEITTTTQVVQTKLTHVGYDEEAWKRKLESFNPSQLSSTYKGASLPFGWKAFETIIVNQAGNEVLSDKVAAFDFDGCLVDTDVRKVGANAWTLLYVSIPEKLKKCHEQGYKLVVFTNESNIERWTKSRQKAIDSKIGRLNGFLSLVKLPMQIVIACGKEGTADPCRKPAPGMWEFMERRLNGNIEIDKSQSFYVGDAAGRAGDHSTADVEFAKAVGLQFFVPEDYFDEEKNST